MFILLFNVFNEIILLFFNFLINSSSNFFILIKSFILFSIISIFLRLSGSEIHLIKKSINLGEVSFLIFNLYSFLISFPFDLLSKQLNVPDRIITEIIPKE